MKQQCGANVRCFFGAVVLKTVLCGPCCIQYSHKGFMHFLRRNTDKFKAFTELSDMMSREVINAHLYGPEVFPE